MDRGAESALPRSDRASAREARKVACKFEQIWHVFVLRFRNEDIESGAPLTIVAARNDMPPLPEAKQPE